MQMTARVRKELGVSVPAASVFRAPHLGSVAARIDSLLAKQRQAAQGPRKRFELTLSMNYPLSYNQRSLWFLAKMNADPYCAAAYNVVLPLRINTPVNFATPRRSLQILIDRHPSLRTVYDDEGGEPYQAVQAEVPLEYMYVHSRITLSYIVSYIALCFFLFVC